MHYYSRAVARLFLCIEPKTLMCTWQPLVPISWSFFKQEVKWLCNSFLFVYVDRVKLAEYMADSLTREELRISTLSGVIWNGETLPTIRVQLWEQYIKQGGMGRTAGSSVTSVCQGPGSLPHLFNLGHWWNHCQENRTIL